MDGTFCGYSSEQSITCVKSCMRTLNFMSNAINLFYGNLERVSGTIQVWKEERDVFWRLRKKLIVRGWDLV